MNISQPFIHHPIATSLQFHHRGKRSDYRRTQPLKDMHGVGEPIEDDDAEG